jgi:NADH-quinone oxidoreductase subunit L
VGFLIDTLTTTMMLVVTFVSLMVHIYTIGYMQEDPGYNRFFSYISLFTFSMLMLVMSNNFMQLFFGWEAVGLVSYLLIGFWYTRPTAIFANMKAFLVNRVGDFGFILGIGLVLAHFGTLDYAEVFQKAPEFAGTTISLFGDRNGQLVSDDRYLHLLVYRRDGQVGSGSAACLAAGLDGRPDADLCADSRGNHGDRRYLHGGPDVAAVRAVDHGAVLRHRDRRNHRACSWASWGSSRTTSSALSPIRRLSQLGYMTVALGASAYSVAIFHLMTHAFFKALLFLAAGSVIIGMHHDQDIRNMGGLRKYMPITWITSLIGSLALIGTPFLSGLLLQGFDH